jgi:hypothetical protein
MPLMWHGHGLMLPYPPRSTCYGVLDGQLCFRLYIGEAMLRILQLCMQQDCTCMAAALTLLALLQQLCNALPGL